MHPAHPVAITELMTWLDTKACGEEIPAAVKGLASHR